MSYSATDLKSSRYDFWVTASTVIGEGQPSPTVSTSPNTKGLLLIRFSPHKVCVFIFGQSFMNVLFV